MIGLASALGLLSALLGYGLFDGLSWFALGGVLFTVVYKIVIVVNRA